MATGTITYVKASQRWLYQIDLGKTPEGKRNRKSKSFKSENEARQALVIELAKINETSQKVVGGISWQGNLVTSQTKLKDFFEYFLSLCTAKPHTVEGYFETVRQIARKIGDVSLQGLTPELIAQFFNDFKKYYAQATINKNIWSPQKSARICKRTRVNI